VAHIFDQASTHSSAVNKLKSCRLATAAAAAAGKEDGANKKK
jgi:hypothetical protein